MLKATVVSYNFTTHTPSNYWLQGQLPTTPQPRSIEKQINQRKPIS